MPLVAVKKFAVLPSMEMPLVVRVMSLIGVCSAYGGCVDGVMV